MSTSQIVLKSGDANSHTAWGFPGMQVVCPLNDYGYKTITYTYTVAPEFLGQLTTYDVTKGFADRDRMNFVQVVPSFSMKADFTNPTLDKNITGTGLLDITKTKQPSPMRH